MGSTRRVYRCNPKGRTLQRHIADRARWAIRKLFLNDFYPYSNVERRLARQAARSQYYYRESDVDALIRG